MDLKLSSLMRPKKSFPTGIPRAITRSHFIRDGEVRKVVVEVVAVDPLDGENEVCTLRMSPDEARSLARVLLDMAGMADAVRSDSRGTPEVGP